MIPHVKITGLESLTAPLLRRILARTRQQAQARASSGQDTDQWDEPSQDAQYSPVPEA